MVSPLCLLMVFMDKYPILRLKPFLLFIIVFIAGLLNFLFNSFLLSDDL